MAKVSSITGLHAMKDRLLATDCAFTGLTSVLSMLQAKVEHNEQQQALNSDLATEKKSAAKSISDLNRQIEDLMGTLAEHTEAESKLREEALMQAAKAAKNKAHELEQQRQEAWSKEQELQLQFSQANAQLEDSKMQLLRSESDHARVLDEVNQAEWVKQMELQSGARLLESNLAQEQAALKRFKVEAAQQLQHVEDQLARSRDERHWEADERQASVLAAEAEQHRIIESLRRERDVSCL